MSNHVVEIVFYDDESVIKRVECQSERHAEKVEDGININLNHEKYFTRIVKGEKP